MKLGKIVELLPSGSSFQVMYGIEMTEYSRKQFSFGAIISKEPVLKKTHVTYMSDEYYLRGAQHDFKEYIISAYDPKGKVHKRMPRPELEEEFLWVVIPYASKIESDSRKVAGRTEAEGIFEMFAGDTVKVKRTDCALETYIVAKAGNELFLVKKNR